MKPEELCQRLVALGKQAGADEIEAFYNSRKTMEVVVEKNDIQVPKGDLYEGIGVRVVKGGKQGFASTNILQSNSLTETIEAGLALAAGSPADPHRRLPDPVPLVEVQGIYDEEGADITLQDLIGKAQSFLMAATATDPRVIIESSSIKAEVLTRAIANSRGIQGLEKKSVFVNRGMAFARDGDEISSFDIEYQANTHLADLDLEGSGRRLRDKVIGSLGAGNIKSFKGDIIMSPSTALDLLIGPLIFAVNADNVLNGFSPWRDKLERRVCSPLLQVEDNGVVAGAIGSIMFDREGLRPRPVSIIKGGVLQEYLQNHYTAGRFGVESNGRAAGNDQSTPGVGPTNLSIKPGTTPLEKIIETIKKGLFVTRYSGNVDPISGDFSGVVKGGYLIEDGRRQKPVKEVMIAGNIYELINNIAAISKEIEQLITFRLPHIQLPEVSITGR